MNDNNQHSIKEALDNLLKVYKLDDKMAERKLIQSWDELMGKMIAKHTKNISIRNKQLFVTVDSAALRNELVMAKSTIIKTMNNNAGKELIKEIIFR